MSNNIRCPEDAEREKQVTDLLERLGRDSDAVASSLRSEGCIGNTTYGGCPLARYLRKNGFENATVFFCDAAAGGVRVALPKPAHAFRVLFDQGHFPELEAK